MGANSYYFIRKEDEMTKEIRDQGRQAKKIADDQIPGDVKGKDAESAYYSGQASSNCPYGPGDNRDAWMNGFGGVPEETVKQTDAVATATAQANTAKTVKKGGKKNSTTIETRPAKGGEGAQETVATTGANTASLGGGTTGAEVDLNDPSKSTTAAENGGVGVNTGTVDAAALM